MADLFIVEYPQLATDTLGRPMLVGLNRYSGQYDQTPIAIGTEAKSAAFQADTHVIRVHAAAICSVKVGPAATVAATTSTARMAAGQTEFFHVEPGWKLSVITNS